MSLHMALTRTGLGYIFTLTDTLDPDNDLVRFEVSSVFKTQWGISGRVVVRSTIATARTVPAKGGYVTTERLDFLNARSRQAFCDRLMTLIPAPPSSAAIDWPLVVEELTAGIMDSEHRQPPILDLSQVQAVSHTPHLWPYLLPERKATILYGAGGTGKSALAAAIASAVQSGHSFLGIKPKQRNVLYLDWETDEGDVAHRISATSRGLGIPSPAPVSYMSLELPLDYEMAHIAAAVAEGDIGLVILDSVGMASSAGRDGSDPAESAIAFFRALRMLNTTVLCIDHISGEDQRRGRLGAAKPYGSVFKWNSARNAFELIDGGEDGRLILRHRKANLGPKMPGGEMLLSVRWDGDTDTVTYRKVDDSVARIPTAERIADALATGPASYRTLMDLLNADQNYDLASEADLRMASRSLLGDGTVAVDHAGVLRLTAKVEPPPVENAPTQLALDDSDEVES